MKPVFCRKPLYLLGAFTLLATACSTHTSTSETPQEQTTLEQSAPDELLFIGTYTQKEGHVDGKAEGVYVYGLNTETGALSQLSTSPPITNPSYLTVHPNGEWLYAVSETGGSEATAYGSVSAFKFDEESKALTPINTASSQGKYPCYISISPSGEHALVANYGGGIALLPLGSDGALQEATSVVQHSGKGPNTARQEGPHAHMVTPGPGNFIYAVDLGTDNVYPYVLDAEKQRLVPAAKPTQLTPGAGPRHLTFHASKDIAYLVNELNGTITAFKVTPATGALEPFQTISTLPEGTTDAAACADIHLHPNGKFLYASNRGSLNNLAIYAVNETSGELQLLGFQPTQGQTPRNFVIHPEGKLLLVANQDSGNVVTFRIDESTGLLTELANTPVPTPVCLKFRK